VNSTHVTTNRGKPALQSTRLLDQVRERIRYLHYSLRTEQAYLLWIRAFVRHHGLRHPRTLGGTEVESFLNALVNQRNISASTHKQALCALLFLYREVLDQDLPWMQQIQRPAIRKHVPAVLTVAQTRDLLDRMQGEPALVARVLYGCGLRLTEALKLRVKDVDFERHVLIVRSGKGGKDRVVMLPRSLVTDLHAQMARARAWWEQDRKLGRPGVEMPDALARKYPKGGTNWGWHWVFPADYCSRDPRSGTERRQHDDHMAIGELDQPVHVLVDHQDGLAGLAKLPQATPDLLADQLGEALGRFVQDQ
jgi:integron integrase